LEWGLVEQDCVLLEEKIIIIIIIIIIATAAAEIFISDIDCRVCSNFEANYPL
jgi:hypothetical protein